MFLPQTQHLFHSFVEFRVGPGQSAKQKQSLGAICAGWETIWQRFVQLASTPAKDFEASPFIGSEAAHCTTAIVASNQRRLVRFALGVHFGRDLKLWQKVRTANFGQSVDLAGAANDRFG